MCLLFRLYSPLTSFDNGSKTQQPGSLWSGKPFLYFCLPDRIPSTGQIKRERLPPLCPRGPTFPPSGITGTTPSEAATARPADSNTPTARRGMMYVISYTAHPPSPSPVASTKVSLTCSPVWLVHKRSLSTYWNSCFSVVSGLWVTFSKDSWYHVCRRHFCPVENLLLLLLCFWLHLLFVFVCMLDLFGF